MMSIHCPHLVVQVPLEEDIGGVVVPALDTHQPRPRPRHTEGQGVPVRVIPPQPDTLLMLLTFDIYSKNIAEYLSTPVIKNIL